MNACYFADTKKFRMVVELQMNRAIEVVYNSVFHNAFKLLVSLSSPVA